MAAVVTEAGVPAWIRPGAGAHRLLSIDAAGTAIELDRGPAGSIAGLRAEGGVVRRSGPSGPREAAP